MAGVRHSIAILEHEFRAYGLSPYVGGPPYSPGIVAIVALLPLFSAVFVAIGPASAQSFTAYLNLDQNLGAFYKTYYSLLPSQAEHSRSLRRILDQSKRFSDLVPSLSGTQTLALHAMRSARMSYSY